MTGKVSGSFTLRDQTRGVTASVTQKPNGKEALEVIASIDGDDIIKPSSRIIHIDRRLANGSNTSMDVNGSSTNQDFTFGPPAGETWYVFSLQMLITDGGSADVGDFGSLGGLTNGVQVIQDINGTEYQMGNFQDNAALSLCFAQHATPSSKDDKDAWFDEDIYFLGVKEFAPYPIELRGDDGDQIIFRIRDNLTGLNEFEAVGRAWRFLS